MCANVIKSIFETAKQTDIVSDVFYCYLISNIRGLFRRKKIKIGIYSEPLPILANTRLIINTSKIKRT